MQNRAAGWGCALEEGLHGIVALDVGGAGARHGQGAGRRGRQHGGGGALARAGSAHRDLRPPRSRSSARVLTQGRQHLLILTIYKTETHIASWMQDVMPRSKL